MYLSKEDEEKVQKLLNKKVSVISKDGLKVNGDLYFAGYNKNFPSWGLVCTVARMPGIRINNINDIKLYQEKEKIIKDGT